MKSIKIGSFTTLLSLFLIVLVSCKQKTDDGSISTDVIHNPNSADTSTVDPSQMPVMTFDTDLFDFGEMIQGERVNTEFKFTNTGKTDLIISAARASCGCTVPEYPKEPIKPGESSTIKVSYNSEGRKDAFNKTVTITANTLPSDNKVRIKSVVVVPSDK